MHVLLVSPPEADTRLYTISEKFGFWTVPMEAPSTFAIQTKTMLPAGHKPALQ